MKVFVTVLALAALAANVAVAKTVKADNRSPYYSHAQGYQAHENPDRVYGTATSPRHSEAGWVCSFRFLTGSSPTWPRICGAFLLPGTIGLNPGDRGRDP